MLLLAAGCGGHAGPVADTAAGPDAGTPSDASARPDTVAPRPDAGGSDGPPTPDTPAPPPDVATLPDAPAPPPDVATLPDTPGPPPDVAALPDTPAPPRDTASGPDTAAPPQPGELGGPCAAGGTCQEGTCRSLPGRAEPRCTAPCRSNDDCPPALRCEPVTFEEQLCLDGPRGTAPLGAPCGPAGGNGCASGLCVDADPDAGIAVDTCTAPCTGDGDCDVPFPICYAFVDLCLPVASGDLGGRCTSQGACYEGACVPLPEGERCTRSCTVGESCGPGWLSCQPRGRDTWCLVRPAP
jgi:hypothetical protein